MDFKIWLYLIAGGLSFMISLAYKCYIKDNRFAIIWFVIGLLDIFIAYINYKDNNNYPPFVF